MSADRKADRKTNRSFKRSERQSAKRRICKEAKTLFLHNGSVYDHSTTDDIDKLKED